MEGHQLLYSEDLVILLAKWIVLYWIVRNSQSSIIHLSDPLIITGLLLSPNARAYTALSLLRGCSSIGHSVSVGIVPLFPKWILCELGMNRIWLLFCFRWMLPSIGFPIVGLDRWYTFSFQSWYHVQCRSPFGNHFQAKCNGKKTLECNDIDSWNKQYPFPILVFLIGTLKNITHIMKTFEDSLYLSYTYLMRLFACLLSIH